MNSVPDWRGILLDASERVQEVVKKMDSVSGSSEVSSVGAGGDRTILVDSEAESAALKVILKVSDVRVISEERGTVGDSDSRWLVLVDPIDGSSNYQHGIPFYCTSIAVSNGETFDQVKFALVRNLINGDVYWAEKGKGAQKNGKPVLASRTRKLAESLVTIDTCRISFEKLMKLGNLITTVKRQVHLGANALELCYLAEGKTDAFVDFRDRMRVTDFAAGYLIACEAGAVVTAIDGSKLVPGLNLAERFSFVASANGELHKKVLGLIS